MSNIALVISQKEKSSKLVNSKFVRRISQSILYSSRKNELAESVKEIKLCEDLNLYLIGLPFSLTELGFINKNKIAGFIKEECTKRGIKSCIIPNEIYSVCMLDGYTTNPYNGKYLFKALLTNILDDIYFKRGIRIGELDIVVIKGENDCELYSVIKQLSPLVKYLSVLTDRKNDIQGEIDCIFEEYGLSVGISENFSLAARNAGLIINLCNSFNILKNIRINSEVVIINYGGKEAARFFDKGILINGIETTLPKNAFSWVDKCVQKFFNETQITEIVLCHKTGLEDMACTGIIDYDAAVKISREFAAGGFRIGSFTGRYGILRSGEIHCLKRQ